LYLRHTQELNGTLCSCVGIIVIGLVTKFAVFSKTRSYAQDSSAAFYSDPHQFNPCLHTVFVEEQCFHNYASYHYILFRWDLPAKFMLISLLWVHATCQAHLILLHLIALIILCK